MNKKIYLYFAILLVNVSVAFAQTLFTSDGAVRFITFGVSAVVVIIILKDLGKRFFKSKWKMKNVHKIINYSNYFYYKFY